MALVTVIGGGISGLSAAYELHRRGVPFQLYEASDRFGGILRTDRVGELVIDAGPDAMLVRKSAGIALCDELGIADRLVAAKPPRAPFVVRDGRLAPLWVEPATPRNSIGTNFSFCHPLPFSDLAETEIRPDRISDESIASFYRRHFDRVSLDYYAEPVLAGIHAGDVERLSINALFPEIVTGAARDRVPDPLGEFRSFPGGMQELVDALVAALPSSALHLSTRAPALKELLDAGPVIVAVPAHAAASLFSSIDNDLAGLCRGIRYVSSGIVVLAYARAAVKHPLGGSGFVVPRVEREFRILAATWLSSKWPGRAPDEVALVRAFFGGAHDPGAMNLTDDGLVAISHHDLSRLLDIEEAPSFSRVYRWINGTPQYEVGYLEQLAAIRARLATHKGLFVTGAGFGTIGIPDCIADSRAVAARALNG